MSSTIAIAKRRGRRPLGVRAAASASTPNAKATSVAIGIPHPWAPGPPRTTTTKNSAGTAIPVAAAITGSSAARGRRSSPVVSSRLISRPATRKKRAIRPSLIQKWRSPETTRSPTPTEIGRASNEKYEPVPRRVDPPERHDDRTQEDHTARSGCLEEFLERAQKATRDRTVGPRPRGLDLGVLPGAGALVHVGTSLADQSSRHAIRFGTASYPTRFAFRGPTSSGVWNVVGRRVASAPL